MATSYGDYSGQGSGSVMGTSNSNDEYNKKKKKKKPYDQEALKRRLNKTTTAMKGY